MERAAAGEDLPDANRQAIAPARRRSRTGGEIPGGAPHIDMRLHFLARPDAQPLEQLVDGFIFLSGGIFDFLERLAATAEATGFGGKVRLDVVARDLLDRALAPLASDYDADRLASAAEVLGAAIERIGREFYAEQYPSIPARGTRRRAPGRHKPSGHPPGEGPPLH
jgi:hypothetical protein